MVAWLGAPVTRGTTTCIASPAGATPALGVGQNAAAQSVHSEARRRLDAHTYLSVPERLEHLAMTCVPAAGLDAGTLTVRLKQLVR
jgi:hypothetical protein